MQYDARGGTVAITALNDGECRPGQGVPTSEVFQRFRFTWAFDREVTALPPNQPVTITFRIEGDSEACLDQNPMLTMGTDGDPVEAVTAGGQRFYFKPGNFHVPGPRVLRFWPGTARQAGYFTVNIWGFSGRRGMQLVFTYPYQLVAAAVPPADASGPDMAQRAARDRRFGPAVPNSAGALPTWSPAWELRWVDFAFGGNRVVRMYHATNKANPAYRYTIFMDPDTGQWAGWEAGGS